LPFIETDKLSIYYETKGDVKDKGVPILYIGGTGGDLRAKPNILDSPLPNSMCTVAYDQRGLGQTDKPEGPYTMAEYADDAAQLLDALEFDRVHVIGVSFGGMVALNFALRHTDRIERLVLCCTSAGGDSASYPFHELPEDISAEDRAREMMGVSDLRCDDDWQSNNPDKVAAMMAHTREHAIADHQSPEFKRGAKLQLLARAGHDVTDRLSEISVPTLLCAGKYDGIAPLANQDFLLSHLPDAALQWFEGGHMFMIQDKKAWPAIIKFLSTES
jgi:3-oxoadipate enol-lactonase